MTGAAARTRRGARARGRRELEQRGLDFEQREHEDGLAALLDQLLRRARDDLVPAFGMHKPKHGLPEAQARLAHARTSATDTQICARVCTNKSKYEFANAHDHKQSKLCNGARTRSQTNPKYAFANAHVDVARKSFGRVPREVCQPTQQLHHHRLHVHLGYELRALRITDHIITEIIQCIR